MKLMENSKRKGFSLDIEGSYDEIQAIIQDIERLQPLLMNSKLQF